MKMEELTGWLEKTPGWTYNATEDGITLYSSEFETATFCTIEAVHDTELTDIIAACHQGRNVRHMTRITGYFSVVEGWNKGKIGELHDRYKNEGAF